MYIPKIKTFNINRIGSSTDLITIYGHRATCSDKAIKIWKTIEDTGGYTEIMVGCFSLKEYFLTSVIGLKSS